MSRLDDLEAKLAKATKGPWKHGPGSHDIKAESEVNSCQGMVVRCNHGIGNHADDVAAIVALRNNADALIAIARAVAEHRRQRRNASENALFKALDRLETDQ